MRLFLTIVAVLLLYVLHAEKLPPILNRLNQANGPINTYPHLKEPFFRIADLPTNYLNVYQHIVKSHKNLYLIIPGTGRVYEIVIAGDSVQLNRKDKTYFTGYNFQSIPFVIDSTLYSFGGYGFWRFNGELRVFMPQIGEWDAILMNRYIPKAIELESANNLHYIDQKEKSLYISGPQFIGEPVKNTEKSPLYGKLYKLNIKDGKWDELGELHVTTVKYLSYTPYGLLCIFNDEYQIIDITQNKILSITGKTKEKLIHTPTSTSYEDIRISYSIGNTLYVGDMENWIDSVYLDPKDIIDNGRLVYTPKNNSTYLILSGIIFFSLIILFIVFKWKKKSVTTNEVAPNYIEPTIHLQSSITNELLEEREKELLEFILTQSKNGKLTSIQQINDLLGLNKRTIEVQKRIRTDMIGAVNTKCRLLTNKEEPILSRNRSDIDKRMFEYFVLPERFVEAEAILNSQKITKTE